MVDGLGGGLAGRGMIAVVVIAVGYTAFMIAFGMVIGGVIRERDRRG